jgi:DNA mismatch repair protein MutS
VVERAQDVLKQLEKSHAASFDSTQSETPKRKVGMSSAKEEMQLSFFQLDDPVLENIREEILKTDINNLTPVEALMKLNEIRKLLGK